MDSLGQLHQHGGANSGLGVAFTPSVSLSSQNHITICRSQIKRLDKDTDVTTSDHVFQMNCTRISESFDDTKDVDDLPVDQHIVHLHSDVLLTSQSVRGGQPPFKATVSSWFRTTDIPKKKEKEKTKRSDEDPQLP